MSGVSIGKVHLFVGWVIFHFHDYIWEKGSTVGGGFFSWTPSETYHWSFTIPNAHCSLLQVVLEWVLGTYTPFYRVFGALGLHQLHTPKMNTLAEKGPF